MCAEPNIHVPFLIVWYLSYSPKTAEHIPCPLSSGLSALHNGCIMMKMVIDGFGDKLLMPITFHDGRTHTKACIRETREDAFS